MNARIKNNKKAARVMTTMSAEPTFRLLVTDRIFESHGGGSEPFYFYSLTRHTDRQTDRRTVGHPTLAHKKVKGSPYSTTERRVPELNRFLAVSLQVT